VETAFSNPAGPTAEILMPESGKPSLSVTTPYKTASSAWAAVAEFSETPNEKTLAMIVKIRE
jgi:hypothetical protein